MPNQMPRAHGEALHPATRGDGGEAHGREEQSVGRNHEKALGRWTTAVWRKVYGFPR